MGINGLNTNLFLYYGDKRQDEDGVSVSTQQLLQDENLSHKRLPPTGGQRIDEVMSRPHSR